MKEIPNTELLKLFFRSVKKDEEEKLYKMYLEGTIFPDFLEFQKFLSNYQKKNNFFAKTLKRYQLIPKEVDILETTLNKEYTVSEYIGKENPIVIESTYEKLFISDFMIDAILSNKERFFISNGIYLDTEYLIPYLIGKIPFVVGICDEKNSPRFQKDLGKIKELKKEYLEKVKIYKAKQDAISTILIYHDGEKK